MRVHTPQKIEQIKILRKKGLSIQQIMKELVLPKTTVWYHIREIHLSVEQRKQLRSKQGGSKARRLLHEKRAEQYAKDLLKSSHREFVQLVAMLYWAEGHKRRRCEFTNSDGKMIAVFLAIIRNILNIKEENIQPTLRIFTGMNEKVVLDYWSHLTKISKRRFIVRLNDGGNAGRTKYGMCRVTIKKGHTTLKLIHSLINLISDEILLKFNTLP